MHFLLTFRCCMDKPSQCRHVTTLNSLPIAHSFLPGPYGSISQSMPIAMGSYHTLPRAAWECRPM